MLEPETVEELANVLESEARVYENILRLSKDKTDIIVKGKVKELEGIVKLEQSLILQVGRLETLREDLVEKVCRALNTQPDRLTLSSLIEHLDGKMAQKLKNSQETMKATLNELKQTNELNSRLIKNSLEFIDFSINLLADTGNYNYGNTGQIGNSKKRNFFDVKL